MMECKEKGKFIEHGKQLWNRVQDLIEYFCHGDLHTGNMLVDNNHKITFFDFIAIRHFDIQATIIESQGLNCVDQDFIKEQYQWIMKWDAVCTRNWNIMN